MKILTTISAVDLKMMPQDVAYSLKDKSFLCFLDSSLYPNKYSKFSYIAWDPKFTIKSYGYKNEFDAGPGGRRYYSYQHPLSFLKQNLRDYTLNPSGSELEDIKMVSIRGGKVKEVTKEREEKLPGFIGGFTSYFSYDLKNYIERLPQNVVDDLALPIFYFNYYDRLLAYNHIENHWYFVRNYLVKGKKEENEGIFKAAFSEDDYLDSDIADIKLMEKIDIELEGILGGFKKPDDIKKSIIRKYHQKKISNIRFKPDIKKSDYIKRVIKAKEYIHNGDVYQVNFTQRFKADLPVEPMDIYYILREKNAAPFSAFMDFGVFSLGSSSPERFLLLKGDVIETRPIKGTRPRGKNRSDDEKKIAELKQSIKDRAELNMIVDLERNDLGKFCYYGTVKVAEHAVVEKYATVFHSVSTVTGKVKKSVDISDIIKATFPGGSITGAPKIRAMEIIDELETVARNVYTGSMGYIGIDGDMDINIVIRTFVIRKNKFYYNVGGGIVADSIPKDEYNETLDKGIALKDTLNFFISGNLKKIL